MSAGAQVFGDKLLLAKLAAAAAIDGHMHDALKKGAEVIRDDAKRRSKSTTVADSIKERKDEKESTPGHPVREIYTDDERAGVEEFGTGPRAGLQGPHNFPARPAMRPAADENHGPVTKAIEDVLGEAIGKM